MNAITLGSTTRLVLATILAVFILQVIIHFEYTPDDTFIYLQYAKNIVGSYGIAFNKGEPTYGFTSPIWLACISVAGWIGVDTYLASKLIDLLVAVLAIVALFKLQMNLSGKPVVALVTVAVFSTHVWFFRWAGSGMETSLAVLLSITTARFLLNQKIILAALSSGLLSLCRPEAIPLVGLGAVIALAMLEEPRARKFISFLITYTTIILPWFLFALFKFGSVIPNTALAKSGGGLNLDGAISTATDIIKTLAVSDGATLVIILVTLLWGKALRLERGAEGQDPPSSSRRKMRVFVWVSFAWSIALPVLYIVMSVNVISRYLLLMSPLIVALTFALLAHTGRVKQRVIVALGILLILQNTVLFELQVRPHLRSFTQGMREVFVPIGKWLRENSLSDAVVLVGDIGAIGYYSERRVCDAAGLVSSEFLSFARLGYSIERIMKEQKYQTACNADYVVERTTSATPTHAQNLTPVLSKAFPGLGVSLPDTVHYVLYRVTKQ